MAQLCKASVAIYLMATEAYAAAMNEAIESASRAEAECDALVARVAKLEAALSAVATAAGDCALPQS
eukprot:COSAG01_NODE_13753_length_1540_cov_111.401804_1_plen_67_part_00